METKKYFPTLIVGVLVAIISAAIWALIGIIFNYELGVIAWAIGGLAGYAVFLVAQENVNPVHQIIAVIASLVGILLGKYSAFAYTYGRDGIASIFNGDHVTLFIDNIGLFFGGFDIVFVILAVVTAWQFPVTLKQAGENKDDIHNHIEQEQDSNSPDDQQNLR